MSGSRTVSLDSNSHSPGQTSRQNAALLGATRAFGRSTPVSKPTSLISAGLNNGALAAAASVHTASSNPSPQSSSRSPSGVPITAPVNETRTVGRTELNAASMAALRTTPPETAEEVERRGRSSSSSQHAALIAAARFSQANPESKRPRRRANTSRKPVVKPKPRRLSEHSRKSRNERPDSTDSSHIPSTTALVNLFERKASTTSNDLTRRPDPIVVRPGRDMPIQSPKPVRTADTGGISSVFKMELEEPLESATSNTTTSKPTIVPPREQSDSNKDLRKIQQDSASDDEFESASEAALEPQSPIPVMMSTARKPSATSQASTDRPPRETLPSSLSSARGPLSKPLDIRPPSRPPTASFEQMSISSQRSGRSIQAQYHQLYPRKMTPLNTGDQLANAIVASSLASSRAPSPRKMEPPPPPSRRPKHTFLGFSRTPSPTKQGHGMLQTLRKPPDSEDDSDSEDDFHPYGKHRKKRLVRKHPNKHHEGDRKRWRDAVTERERKRYEGVWAANRGIYTSFSPEEEKLFQQSAEGRSLLSTLPDRVSNLAVKELWSRSRLAENILEMVWDLVDNDLIGRLSREEFVVGLWLIDQRLKGRKLPVKVSDTVWASVRSLEGIKIKKR